MSETSRSRRGYRGHQRDHGAPWPGPGLPALQRWALCRSGTGSCCRRRDDRPGVHTAGVLPAALIQLPGIRCHTHADPRASRIKVGAGLRQLALEPPEPLQLIANGMSLGLLAQTTRWVNPGPDHPETGPQQVWPAPGFRCSPLIRSERVKIRSAGGLDDSRLGESAKPPSVRVGFVDR